MSGDADFYLSPEDGAEVRTDRMLRAAGWDVQTRDSINFYGPRGVAVREYLLKGALEVDYLLFADGKAVGALCRPPPRDSRGVASPSNPRPGLAPRRPAALRCYSVL